MYVEVDKGPKKNGCQAGFGPQATVREPLPQAANKQQNQYTGFNQIWI